MSAAPGGGGAAREAYGVKAIRQLRNNHSTKQLNVIRPSLQRQEVMEKTYDYFLREVDPLVGDCVTYLLCSQPDNVAMVMLEYFTQRKKGIKMIPTVRRDKPEKASKAQRLYLATQISPVLTKIVNRIATHRPQDVLSFICVELEHLIQSHEDERISNAAGSRGKSVVPQKVHQGPKTMQILVLGNFASGKTSFINAIQGKSDPNVRPTIGFRPTNMMLGNDQVKFYDLGGGAKIRGIWPEYFHDVHGVVYLIDASIKEGEAFQDSVKLFRDTLSHPSLANKPLLIIANKQDIPGAMSSNEIGQKFSLNGISMGGVPTYHIAETCTSCLVSSSSDGPEVVEQEIDPRVESSIEWIINEIVTNFHVLNERVEADTKEKQLEEARKRVQRERKVLKTKILCAFPQQVLPELLTPDLPTTPEDVFTKDEGESFLASEIGEERDNLPPIALEITELIGYQRLALQMIGALKAPITKKKQPMTWEEIRALVIELRKELGLSVPSP